MREIKLRGMDANGVMRYGRLSQDKENSTVYYKEFSQRICWDNSNIPVSNISLGQFTGLKDKNGKEIYEWDIIKSTALSNDHNQRGATIISAIEFFGCSYCLSITKIPIYPFSVDHTIEVIGNVFENPELCKE